MSEPMANAREPMLSLMLVWRGARILRVAITGETPVPLFKVLCYSNACRHAARKVD